MAERQLGIIRRASLKDVAEGWDECFLTFRPAALGELAELKETNPEKMSETEGITFMTDFVKKHTIGGRVMVVADAHGTSLEVADLTLEDINFFPADILMQLFAEVSGSKLDPKDLQKAVDDAKKSTTSESPTGTPSSTAAESPETSSTTSTSSDTASAST